MKKFLSFCLVILFFFGVMPKTTWAVGLEKQSVQELETVQQEIDAIFKELNEMVAEEKMAELLAAENRMSEQKVAAAKEENNQRKLFLEKRLENLGVNTIDPNNPDDMAALEEVMLGNSGVSARSVPNPPNLSAIANCYTLQQYTSDVTVNGISYPFSYIYVTDNKGYSNSPLTHSQTTNILIGKKSTILRDILEYQFSFGFSSYLGLIPGGWIADWTIGTVCAALESYNENSIISYSGNNNIYNMSMLSVTQMMYVYVYLPNVGWCLCGTRAPNISYARVEYVIANVEGSAVSKSKNYPTVTSSTGSAAYTYAQAYVNSEYHDIDYIGSFTVNAYESATVRFTPGFAPNPAYLT